MKFSMKVGMKKIIGILSVVTILFFSGCSLRSSGIEIENVKVLEKDTSGQFILFRTVTNDKQLKEIINIIQNLKFEDGNDIELNPQYQFYLGYASNNASVKAVNYTLQKSNENSTVIVGMADTNKITKLDIKESQTLYQLIVGEPL